MDIKTALIEEHSKAQALRIARWIGDNPERFQVLMDILLGDDSRLSQRSAWAMQYSVGKYPFLIRPHLKVLVQLLRKPVHDGVKRNILRILQDVKVPYELYGELADICFTFLNDPMAAIAIRVFSMTVLYNICLDEPDLKHELRIIIEEHMPEGSAAFKSRGRRILKQLAR